MPNVATWAIGAALKRVVLDYRGISAVLFGRAVETQDVPREAVEGLDALFDDPEVLEIPPRTVKPKK